MKKHKLGKRLAEQFRELSQHSQAIVVILLIGIVGSIWLISVSAAGPHVSLEPENGLISGNACSVDAGLSSGGKAVQFGNCNVVTIPSNITSGATCAATLPDVSKQMQAWVDSWPDNATIRLGANRCYHVEYPVLLHDANNDVFDGNNSIWAAYTDGCAGTRTATHTFINCKYPSPVDALGRTQDDWPERRYRFDVRANTNLTIKNINVRGGKSVAGYDAGYAFQHGFNVGLNTGLTIDNVKLDNIWGDFVFMAGKRDDNGVNHAPTNVTIKNSQFGLNSGGATMGAGRQMIAIDDGDNIHIQNNKIYNGSRSAVDIEPVSSGAILHEIYFDNNEFGPSKLGFFANHPYGDANPIINGIYFRNNNVIGDAIGADGIVGGLGTPVLDNINQNDPSTYRRHNYQFINNTGSKVSGSGSCTSPAANFRLWGIDGIIIQNNTQPGDFNRCSTIINANKDRNIKIIGNSMLWAGGVGKYVDSALYCERDNMIGSPLALAPLTPGATKCP